MITDEQFVDKLKAEYVEWLESSDSMGDVQHFRLMNSLDEILPRYMGHSEFAKWKESVK
jgi:hypothetical protein